jgi:hypothetical protein
MMAKGNREVKTIGHQNGGNNKTEFGKRAGVHFGYRFKLQSNYGFEAKIQNCINTGGFGWIFLKAKKRQFPSFRVGRSGQKKLEKTEIFFGKTVWANFVRSAKCWKRVSDSILYKFCTIKLLPEANRTE